MVKNLSLNDKYLQKMMKVFDALRLKAHINKKETVDNSEETFRDALESRILVQYRNKVDSLLIKAAELEDMIKTEQDAREKMTHLYDQSISQGFHALN